MNRGEFVIVFGTKLAVFVLFYHYKCLMRTQITLDVKGANYYRLVQETHEM